ncbi:MAG: HAD-IA family hydrolase [Bacteroidota bacterium]|nr:HAD-IA family hydrolase [Bacteroidota bacterium]
MIKGILFDMDGVLVDSEPFICEAAVRMFEELRLKVKPDDFKPFVGMGENRYIGGVAEKYGLNVDIVKVKARTYEIYKTIIKGRLEPLPGVREFIFLCRQKGLKMAVATSADLVKMKANLAEIHLDSGLFDATVNGLEVEKKKPYPDIYIKASEKIGLKTVECLVVEDAPSGIQAAIAAGCKCLAVISSFGKSRLKDADWICNSLLQVPEEALSW